MTKRFRLLATAQMHGAVREPGYIFTIDEGERGPHRTVVASNHGAQITDHMNEEVHGKLKDVPMYEEIDEDGKPVKSDEA